MILSAAQTGSVSVELSAATNAGRAASPSCRAVR
jgi:hypothetical protein